MRKHIISLVVSVVIICGIAFNYDYFEKLVTQISDAAMELVDDGTGAAVEELESELDDLKAEKFFIIEETESTQDESGSTSPKGLIGHDFEDYLTKNIGGDGSFSVGGRDFDGGIGNRWWEAKSGNYWNMLESNPNKLAKFKSDMGARLRIATENGATYELFSNTPIPNSIKQWLDKKGIAYTELLN